MLPHVMLQLAFGTNTFFDRNVVVATAWTFARGVWPLIIWLSSRQDGSTMIHDRATDTRVVEDHSEPVVVSRRGTNQVPSALVAGVSRLGPFDVLGVLWSRPGEELRLGFDPLLKRQVWLHVVPLETPALSQIRRDMSRPTRLRWLTGQRSSTDAWDAFEAPSGAGFEDACGDPHGFAIVKPWLTDLTRELGDAESERERPRLSFDRVWITGEGRALLLDFAAPASSEASAPAERQASSTTPLFLLAIAQRALEGPRDERVLRHGELPSVSARVPLSIRVALDDLASPMLRTAAEAATILEPLAHVPDNVSRWRRALPIGLAAVPLISVLSLTAVGSSMTGPMADAHVVSLCLKEIQGGARRNWTPQAWSRREAFEVYVVGRYRPLLTEPRAFTLTELRGLQPFARVALMEHPRVSPDELAQATALVQPLLDAELQKTRRAAESLERDGLGVILGAAASLVLTPLALGALLLSLFKPGGITIGMAGIAVVNRRGEEISRGRSLLRTAVTWSPIFLTAAVGVLLRAPSAGTSHAPSVVLVWAPVVLMAAGAIWSLLTPERGPQDRLSGTYLVPR
jgi:hypothetical protein